MFERYLGDIRTKRLEKEKHALLDNRLKIFAQVVDESRKQGGGQSWPWDFDIALHMPEVREAITVPADVQVDADSFAFLRDTNVVTAFVAKWSEARAEELRALLEERFGPLDTNVDAMSLVVARFQCWCWRSMVFPEILFHYCTVRGLPPPPSDDEYVCAVQRVFQDQQRWKITNVMLATNAELVVKLCGLDPRQATRSDMDLSPIRLACKTCDSPAVPGGMVWIDAVST